MKRILIFSMLVILALACQDEQLASEKSPSGFTIKTGTICGWCSKNDTLSIIGNSVRYVNYTQCNNSIPALEKTGEMNNAELDSLLMMLDFGEFKKIELNTCNVCADGCDTWIYIQNDGDSHLIRFTGNESNLDPVKEFIERLNAIKMTYQ